jgi:membrane fusion protein (multidrug efflux system)
VLVVGGAVFYLLTGRTVSTDDAYVKSRVLSVTTDVAGQIVEVPVADNQTVKAGDVLVRIDPEPYRLKLATAEAELARTVQDAEGLRATVRGQQASLAQAQSDLAYYQHEFDRQRGLVKSGAVAQSGFDKAQRDLADAQARISTLDQEIRSDLAKLSGNIDTPTEQLPSYMSAVAARDIAAYNLDHATIRAARDGRVGAIMIRPGTYAAPGQALFPEIVTSDTWIEANVRETDLNYVRDGQPATFTVDAYPGHEFHARVQSFSPATGSELSVLPAENATGNWVKIVQRLPLRLTPELHPDDPPLRAGLSVNVEIDTGAYHHMPRFLRRMFGLDAPEAG